MKTFAQYFIREGELHKIKTTILCLALTIAFNKNTEAQTVTIPDATFAAWLTTNYPSCMSGGNQLDTTCANIVNEDSVSISGQWISDLTGIKYFVNLTKLNCPGNALISLSTLPLSLTFLNCSGNQLTSLPTLPLNLNFLYCGGNQLTSLPTLPSTLKELHCSFNPLISLPALPNSLTYLECTNDPPLSALPTLPNSLIYLNCTNNTLNNLPALPNSLLYLFCNWSNLTSLPTLPASLYQIDCGRNLLTSLPALPASLRYLGCSYNQLTSLPFLPASLISLDCEGNFTLTNLPVLPSTLRELGCAGNQLTSLPALPDSVVYLDCRGNQLTCLPHLPDSLHYLDFSFNTIACVPNIPTKGPFASGDDSLHISVNSSYPICTPNESCYGFYSDSVWAGDANSDLIANNIDLLAIGVAYGETGTMRLSASNDWVGQVSLDWADTLANGINKKHTDCNGDGLIDDNDTIAISLNYGQTHTRGGDDTQRGGPNDPNLSLQFPLDSVAAGSVVTVPIMFGDANIQASNVYGIAFTINYDKKFMDSLSVNISFNNSWMGTFGTNLIGIQKDFYTEGKVEAAVVRTDHQNISGFGQIGELSFVMVEDIAGFKTSGNVKDSLVLTLSNVKVISNDELELPVNLIADTLTVYQDTTSTRIRNIDNLQVKTYPNPVKGLLNVNMGNLQVEQINIINMIGQSVYTLSSPENSTLTISTDNFPTGVYLLSIRTKNGVTTRRISVMK